MLTGSATAQVQCGFGAGSLRGQGYIIRDSPVPGTKGLVSGVGAPPYKLAASRKISMFYSKVAATMKRSP